MSHLIDKEGNLMMLKTTEEIECWLDSMGIGSYTINEDLTVDVNGDVDISDKALPYIPVQFGVVSGYFNCSDNSLKNLIGSPKKVIGGFYSSDCGLLSLEGGPESVGDNFECNDNKLTSLEFCPLTVGAIFDCSHNIIETLKYAPLTVGSHIFAYNNPIKDFLDFNCDYGGSFKLSSRISVPMFEEYYKHSIGIEKFELVLNSNKMREILDFERKKLNITNHHDFLKVELSNDKITKPAPKRKI